MYKHTDIDISKFKDETSGFLKKNFKGSKVAFRTLIIVLFLFCIPGLLAVISTLGTGLTIWAVNDEIVWGIAIVNFVFWIGIGHAGTLISAILLLFRQDWRKVYNRQAEAMTIVAIICAAFFPLLHTGRPWLAVYRLFPFPNDTGLAQNFQSPLMWDFYAIGTYLIISVIFFWFGLFPDLRISIPFLKGRIRKRIYKLLSVKGFGEKIQWAEYNKTYMLIAGLVTPLVISVHSIVSYDFAVTFLKGWHSTIYPVHFVAGAIFSGLAMIVILTSITRYLFKLEAIITKEHFDKIAKMLLSVTMIILYCQLVEEFGAWFSNDTAVSSLSVKIYENFSSIYLIMFLLNIIIPLILIFKKARHSLFLLNFISVCILAGMWLERYFIVVSGQSGNVLYQNGGLYIPTFIEIAVSFSGLSFFLMCFLLVIRFFPAVTIFENGRENGK